MKVSFTRAAAFVAITAVWFCLPAFGQQVFDNWKITPGADGKSATMTYMNPTTQLSIESEFDIDVDNAGEPVKGTIKLKTGLQRAMSTEEVVFYLEQYKGDQAYWDFAQAQAKINSFTSQTDQITFSFLGRKSRVLTTENAAYIGTLGVNANMPTWFTLDIKGFRLLFFRQAVKEIQQMK
jgi:hypothetical protein